MAVPVLESAFVAGELSASVAGRYDVAKIHVGAFTFRNFFVRYTGGASSRGGTAFVGFSKQTGRSVPPRMIPFQFSINQGLGLEFGNFYMRVVLNGSFVTETPISITGITNAIGAVVTASATGAASATPNDAGVTISYAPSDLITLAGGVFAVPAVLSVTNTRLTVLGLNSAGTGIYAPSDTIELAGGTQTSAAVLTVLTTQAVSAAIASAGSGGSPGSAIVTGTTGAGTKFQANVTINGSGAISAVNSIALAGSYTVNPSSPTAEPVTGGGLSGATLNVKLGVLTFTISTPGVFTANPAGGTFTQASTSGFGTGATFRFALMAPNAVAVSNPGVYTTFPGNPVAQASNTGSGQGATFNCVAAGVSSFSNGDWVNIVDVNGMPQVNNQTYVIGGATTTSFELFDVYGNEINSTTFGTYLSGGTISKIFTLQTQYSEQDLLYLKYTQSADVMSLCCVNQMTGTEYASLDLTRTTDTSWSFAPVVPGPSILPPAALTGVASTSGSVDYNYVVTAVNPNDGTESIASPVADIPSAVDIASTAGSITLTWDTVIAANSYNIYKATPAYAGTVPAGALFGFAGSAYGTQFVDSNIVADDTQVPPTHQDPFARGQIVAGVVTGGGSGSSFTYTINTLTGSGAVLIPVVVSSVLVALIVQEPGQNYQPSDTIALSGGATATLTIGAQSGTYPSVPFYFQERRGYANTLNNPDTYFMSQPGAFTNFDSRNPTIDSDAIIGSPWSVQVNGIQWAIQTSGGLLVLTGLSAWLLVGAGSFATNVQAISPSTQDAVPQAFTGASSTVPPQRINYDVIYLNSKSTTYYDLPYQLYALSEPIDITENSSQLFVGYTIRENAWCETPYKLMWAVRNDGILLSLTYYKTQQVAGWARHDTNGLFQSVCSVTEPPVDALYTAVQRFPGNNTAYMIERMDNRIWPSIESSWCVDAGLALAQPQPNATLTASSATGLGSITGVTGLVPGALYSAGTTASVVDENVGEGGPGPGVGAIPTITIGPGGTIASVVFLPGQQGSGYLHPKLIFNDPAGSAGGSGAFAKPILNNTMTFMANAAVFGVGNVGSVIRMGGGIATITGYTSPQSVVANIITPIVGLVPNSGGLVTMAGAGQWSMTAPVTTISGLNHLIGATVTGLADGNPIAPQVVTAQGTITLATPASSVVVGLAFMPQLQSVFLDAGEPTVQGQRKKIAAVTVRVEASRGFKIGTNMPDGSRLSPQQVAPVWNEGPGGLVNAPIPADKIVPAYNSNVVPMFTGDLRIPVPGGYDTRGQVAVQQDMPLPLNLLAFISEVYPGDTVQTQAPKKQERAR